MTHLCARGGCTAEATGKHCSRRCAAIARLCAGWRPQAALLRPDVREKACRRGALATAAVMRRRRAAAVREQLAPLLKHRVFSDLDAEGRAAVAALLGKAFRIGKSVGYQEGYHAKDTPRLKRAQRSAA